MCLLPNSQGVAWTLGWRIYIPTEMYQGMGFVSVEEAQTWKSIPVPGIPCVTGQKVSPNLPVTLHEHKGGYYQIGDVEDEKPLWIKDTEISKFPR